MASVLQVFLESMIRTSLHPAVSEDYDMELDTLLMHVPDCVSV